MSSSTTFQKQSSSKETAHGNAPQARTSALVWLNHYALLPGGPDLTTTHDSTNSGVGGGLTALVVRSSTVGDTFAHGGNKVVEMAVTAPPRATITGVRVCYELTNPRSFITQVRLAQVQDPPASAVVKLDDGTNLTAKGPVCVDTRQATSIDAGAGPVLLSLRLNFGSTADAIAIRGVGLHVTLPA